MGVFSSHPEPCFLSAGYVSWAQLWQLNMSRHGKVSPLQKNNFLLRTPDLILTHLLPQARPLSSLSHHEKESSDREGCISKSYWPRGTEDTSAWMAISPIQCWLQDSLSLCTWEVTIRLTREQGGVIHMPHLLGAAVSGSVGHSGVYIKGD